MRPIAIGATGRLETTVGPEHTANAIGNVGVMVLSSPHVLAFAEGASGRAVLADLEEGEATVGVEFHFHHRAPAAVGQLVITTSEVVAVDGRRVHFQFHTENGEGRLLADGTVTFAIVNLARMNQRG